MAIDELVCLRTNLNLIDNEANNDYLILLIYLLLILDFRLYFTRRPVELEVAAGVDGQETMLFIKELFQMYTNDANFRKWSFEIVEYDKTDILVKIKS
jgi:hypothetical protein